MFYTLRNRADTNPGAPYLADTTNLISGYFNPKTLPI
jgi:hypothetical protein